MSDSSFLRFAELYVYLGTKSFYNWRIACSPLFALFLFWKTQVWDSLTLGRTSKLIPPLWYKGVGGGGVGTPPLGFRSNKTNQMYFAFSR